jgi:hypothetical protein
MAKSALLAIGIDGAHLTTVRWLTLRPPSVAGVLGENGALK